MALKLTSGDSSPTAGVSHVLIRATINVQQTQATGIYVDPDSLNRIFTDTYAVSDVTFLLIQKTFNESVSLADAPVWVLAKPTTDPLTVSDTFSRTVSYSRAFSDGFFLDDSALIDKDFVGNKGNLFGLSDTDSWGFTKPVTDPLTVGDAFSRTVSYSRAFTDSASIADATPWVLTKPATDSVSIADTSPLVVAKPITDSVSISDTNPWVLTKPATDSMSISDTSPWVVAKSITDGMSIGDSISVLHISASSRINASSFNIATFNS